MAIAKNITYEYAMTSQSNLKEINLALKELREAIDGKYSVPEVPGHSVSLDILSTLKDIVAAKIGDDAELNKEYPNDMAGIADMIRQLAANYPEEADADPDEPVV